MTNVFSVKDISATYGELALVEQPAVDCLAAMGWETANLYHETFGADGAEGRVSASEVILLRRLRSALERINPGFPASAYDKAITQLIEDRSKQLPVNANHSFYKLLRDRVKVDINDDEGNPQTVELSVIDWNNPENNNFFLAQQMWVSGEMYKRRCDLLGFVNGIPLVFIELKGPHVALKSAYDDNLKDYKGQSIPQLFHPNAFILLSNGLQTRVGTITSAWEHFFEWKRIDDEEEVGSTTLDTALRGLCNKKRLLDLIENFTLFEEARGGLIKKVAKNHQYLGVNKAIAQMIKLRESGVAAIRELRVSAALVGVELLDQAEHVPVILSQQQLEVIATVGLYLGSGDCPCGRKGRVDLAVQFSPIGNDHKGPLARQLAQNLLGEEHHRQTFATALGMPEHPQPFGSLNVY